MASAEGFEEMDGLAGGLSELSGIREAYADEFAKQDNVITMLMLLGTTASQAWAERPSKVAGFEFDRERASQLVSVAGDRLAVQRGEFTRMNGISGSSS